MAEDRKFSHPVPLELVLLIIAVTQGVAHLGLIALRAWAGVEAPHWFAGTVGAGAAVLLVSVLSRRLAQ